MDSALLFHSSIGSAVLERFERFFGLKVAPWPRGLSVFT